MPDTQLLWLGQDLRLDDQPLFHLAAQNSQPLLCVYVLDPLELRPNRYGFAPMGSQRLAFLLQGIQDLDQSLSKLGQKLHLLIGDPLEQLTQLITQENIGSVLRSRHSTWNEQQLWNQLQKRFPYLHYQQPDSRTLFSLDTLPVKLDPYPKSFSQFRRQVEKQAYSVTPLAPPQQLPPAPRLQTQYPGDLALKPARPLLFQGGETSAQAHLHTYFSSEAASSYKETRNALQGWTLSTKFSFALAQGSLSPRRILQSLHAYEQRQGANESTYWIYFELLWREYFQWYAQAHGVALFRFRGLNTHRPLTSFYPQAFKSWCEGTTPWPLVNACMKELKATGYMSNRGRQLVASCLVNELALDWRWGAAWFEHHLLDYDAASNWGNWQYLAGVGADPRGQRQFNLNKQAQVYDPNGDFVRTWQGDQGKRPLYQVDAADWPI
ncbi:DASH family cryptochrome [Nitrincola tapanii]|uniref:Cryptochrome DASH n=1 Tax=Nitrincola tapanii TaxID=1708751 RepID=A0A5A9W4E9_9GAMM|nr:DASH family cryptochrome [Nitrincola tapanii]KAA0875646.1 DASH family cryptochrome [Nitrincola tapanii]